MLRRLVSLILLALMLGFIAFAVTLPRPADDRRSDAVVVLTGGERRIDRGLEVVRRGWAPQLLVSGVDPEVRAHEFAAHYAVPPRLMACCVTLGYEAVDTRSNARETAEWVAAHHIRSLRVVSSDWHLRRALRELRLTLPANIVLIPDAVPTRPSFNILVTEYGKLLARQVQILWQH
ncbi:MAG: YdcF family protein [Sphingomonadales bacterium]|nr:YdcF family protein [Sphingomonadales bacterium]